MNKIILICAIILFFPMFSQSKNDVKNMDKIDEKYYDMSIQLSQKNKKIKKLQNTIKILRGRIDSLQLIIMETEPEYVFVTLIKDLTTEVEIQFQSEYSKAEEMNIIDGRGELTVKNLTHIYIIDTLGRTYNAIWDNNYIYVNDLQESMYFLVAIDNSGKIFTYKFII